MFMYIGFLSILFLISARFAIVFKQQKNTKMYSVFKPLTTFLIIVIASLIYLKVPSIYAALIIVSLVFSLVGDLFLLREKHFLQGLLSFLIAHIVFTFAFVSIYGFSRKSIPLILLLIAGGFYYNYLKKGLHKYAIPVAVYMLVIIFMCWQAIGLVFNKPTLVFFGIASAALLFAFSDSVLAYAKFKKAFKAEQIFVLTTYWVALYLFTIAGIWIVG